MIASAGERVRKWPIMPDRLTHFDEAGRAQMVDIGDKPVSRRRAVAIGQVALSADALRHIMRQQQRGQGPFGDDGSPAAGDCTGNDKGDVLTTAQLAGIMASKRTAELIPLCHSLPLSKVKLRLDCDHDALLVQVRAEVETQAQTGVEMEALTAVSIACLTVYDMLKSADRNMVIGAIRLVEKSGGQSGDWTA